MSFQRSSGVSGERAAKLDFVEVRHQLERVRENRVAEQHGGVRAVFGEKRRRGVAQRGVVENVVVDERREVNQLDRRGGAHRVRLDGVFAFPAGKKHERRAQPFPAMRERVAQAFPRRRRELLHLRLEKRVERLEMLSDGSEDSAFVQRFRERF